MTQPVSQRQSRYANFFSTFFLPWRKRAPASTNTPALSQVTTRQEITTRVAPAREQACHKGVNTVKIALVHMQWVAAAQLWMLWATDRLASGLNLQKLVDMLASRSVPEIFVAVSHADRIAAARNELVTMDDFVTALEG